LIFFLLVHSVEHLLLEQGTRLLSSRFDDVEVLSNEIEEGRVGGSGSAVDEVGLHGVENGTGVSEKDGKERKKRSHPFRSTLLPGLRPVLSAQNALLQPPHLYIGQGTLWRRSVGGIDGL